MELELKKQSFDTYEAGTETTLTAEETAETIVPDYCPDMARIIDTEGMVFLHGRDFRDGKATLSGTVRITVLYTPEGEGGIRSLEFAIPFSVESEALPECAYLTAEVEPEMLESRMLNPRKVFTHCKLVARVTTYQRTALRVCPDVETGPELCVEKRRERQRATLLTHVAEKDFTFSEEMNLSPGREGASEILSSQVRGCVTETKLVGSKLLFKGVFHICLLYRTAQGQYCSTSGELPFSQIMEVEGAQEGSSATVRLQLTGADLQIDGGDPEGRQLAVTLYLHATALVRREEELTLLRDLYSTAYELTYEASPMSLVTYWESTHRRQNVRESLEIGVVAEDILSVQADCGTVAVSREGGGTVLRTVVFVRALYLDEGGTPLMAERGVEVSCQTDLPADCRVFARASCAEEPQGSLTERGIEVRFPVEFQIEAAAQTKKVCISAVRVDTDSPKDLSGSPSLVLRQLGQQESPWDLAKRYNTTISTILSANQLETEEDLPRDTLLLIPRKRA